MEELLVHAEDELDLAEKYNGRKGYVATVILKGRCRVEVMGTNPGQRRGIGSQGQ